MRKSLTVKPGLKYTNLRQTQKIRNKEKRVERQTRKTKRGIIITYQVTNSTENRIIISPGM